MKCLIVGKLVSCILAGTPTPSGVEAAKILTQSVPPYVYTAPPDLDGPKVYFLGSSPTDGPFGSFGDYPVQRPLNCCSVYVHRSFGGFGWHARTFGSTVVTSPLVGSVTPLGSVRGVVK